MIIKVKANGRKFIIPVPVMLGFLCPGLTAKIIKKEIKKDFGDLSDKQIRFALRKMKKALRDSKKIMKDIPLVDVKSSNGEEVKIFL